MPLFGFAFSSLLLIFGIVATVLVSLKWKTDVFKVLMIAFIASAFLIPAVLGIVSLVIFELAMNNGYSRGPSMFELLFNTMSVLNGLIPVLSAMILLGYIFARINQSNEDDNSKPVLSGLVDETGTVHYPAAGPSWNTDLNGQQLVSILRRREWAFLIDILPSLVVTSVAFWLMALTVDGSGGSPIGALLMVVAWITNLATAIYLPLKDCLGGVSVGKSISKCRVVDASNGKPIGPGQSIARNFIFLIPLMPLVEVLVASFRSDRRRLGDLMANTIVVSGLPDLIDGFAPEYPQEDKTSEEKANTPHPLDD